MPTFFAPTFLGRTSTLAVVLAALAPALAGCSTDDEPPIVHLTSPADFSRSVDQYLQVRANVTEETQLDEVTLWVDGAIVDRDSNFVKQDDGCSCDIQLEWDTSDAAIGSHTIEIKALDEAGNLGDDRVEIELVERLLVTGIMVSMESDDGIFDATLEVEVHLRDADTSAFIGCTGNNQGMQPADRDDIYYGLAATFVSPMDVALELADVQDLNLIARVIENDDADQCPAGDGADVDTLANDDDLLGISPAFQGQDFLLGTDLSFIGVPTLEMRWGRAGGR